MAAGSSSHPERDLLYSKKKLQGDRASQLSPPYVVPFLCASTEALCFACTANWNNKPKPQNGNVATSGRLKPACVSSVAESIHIETTFKLYFIIFHISIVCGCQGSSRRVVSHSCLYPFPLPLSTCFYSSII